MSGVSAALQHLEKIRADVLGATPANALRVARDLDRQIDDCLALVVHDVGIRRALNGVTRATFDCLVEVNKFDGPDPARLRDLQACVTDAFVVASEKVGAARPREIIWRAGSSSRPTDLAAPAFDLATIRQLAQVLARWANVHGRRLATYVYRFRSVPQFRFTLRHHN